MGRGECNSDAIQKKERDEPNLKEPSSVSRLGAYVGVLWCAVCGCTYREPADMASCGVAMSALGLPVREWRENAERWYGCMYELASSRVICAPRGFSQDLAEPAVESTCCDSDV